MKPCDLVYVSYDPDQMLGIIIRENAEMRDKRPWCLIYWEDGRLTTDNSVNLTVVQECESSAPNLGGR